MDFTLTGASGFIGKRLLARLRASGHGAHVLGRRPVAGAGFSQWDASSGSPPPAEAFRGADVIFHLAGEPVAQRWNDAVKQRIRDSRIGGTNALVDTIGLLAPEERPKVLVAASAIGYYGDRADEVLEENSSPGQGFLPEVCVAWENAANKAAGLGLRVVLIRIGIVLGADGGALEQMLPIFRMGAGGQIGSGKQWMSWIHVDDLVSLLLTASENSRYSGAVNGTAPQPVTNAVFTKELAGALGRPAIVPVPTFALRAMYGEMAGMLTGGQRVLPSAALSLGYRFQYPDLAPALESILKRA